MIAKLWAEQIINGKKTFEQVPSKLKELVKAILIENNRDDLVVE